MAKTSSISIGVRKVLSSGPSTNQSKAETPHQDPESVSIVAEIQKHRQIEYPEQVNRNFAIGHYLTLPPDSQMTTDTNLNNMEKELDWLEAVWETENEM